MNFSNKDFRYSDYKKYLFLIKENTSCFYTFKKYLSSNIEVKESFCLIRHDVDRKPENALKMALLENKLGIQSTYYFRYKKHTFNKKIIKRIHALGHEIGYHYENLSDCNGDSDKALIDFEKNLEQFRKIAPIYTISMHGRPLSRYDNRDLWKDEEKKKILHDKLNILGEVYLDIDYTNIAYINDTGRNWTSSKANLRDQVSSDINADFKNSLELIEFLKNSKDTNICFQIHPERWEDNYMKWAFQYTKDYSINTIKTILKAIR